ncbi:MAG: hypothetical protein R3264_16115 [Anaerolineae bacterium]|nr:hypothetical protein [Anaerolineae bacterium]
MHQALRLDPNWAPAHQGLGACYEDKLELGRALYHYRQAARLAPFDPSSHDNVQRLESGHFLAQLNPNDPTQVARLATLCAARGGVALVYSPDAMCGTGQASRWVVTQGNGLPLSPGNRQAAQPIQRRCG